MIKSSIRLIFKHKSVSFITIFGLSTAMAVSMLLILMVADQFRYDDFHANKDRIYRILTDYKNSRQPYSTSPLPLSQALVTDYDVAQDVTTLTPDVGGDARYGSRISDMRGYFADESFFRIFSFTLERGDVHSALNQPRSMVISSEMAHRLFGLEDPIGKTIDFTDRGLPFPVRYDGVNTVSTPWGYFTVTGVIDQTKYKSHLSFDVLLSASTRATLESEKKITNSAGSWDWFYRTYTYVLLRNDRDESDLSAALTDIASRHCSNLPSDEIRDLHFIPQPIGEIQLNLVANDTNNRLPRIGYYFLGGLAAVIMALACLNYTNLTIARALTRTREIGVRKVIGASRRSLIFQFLGEAIVTALFALGAAIGLLALIRPAFRGLWVNQYLAFELPFTAPAVVGFVLFAIAIGLVAGILPAIHLSRHNAVLSVKGIVLNASKSRIRRVLGVTQFIVSLVFITASILVYRQFRHFMDFDYGFTARNVINIELQGVDYQKLSHAVASVPGVSGISGTDIIPASGRNNGIEIRRWGTSGEYAGGSVMRVDANFIETLDIKLLAGRNLNSNDDAPRRFVLVNEAAATKLGFTRSADIVGQAIESKGDPEPYQVVGVVSNFRHALLLNAHDVAPLILRSSPADFMYANVRVTTGDLPSSIARLETVWQQLDPVHSFKYSIFDQQLAATHQGILDLVSILGTVSFLSITIACLGLLGMTIWSVERRIKEVGIRKVMGAGEWGVALLLSREFYVILGLALTIGTPLSFAINNFWLSHLPNRVNFSWTVLASSAISLLLLGTLTIISQTVRVARTNPAETLRNE